MPPRQWRNVCNMLIGVVRWPLHQPLTTVETKLPRGKLLSLMLRRGR